MNPPTEYVCSLIASIKDLQKAFCDQKTLDSIKLG